MTEDDTFNKLRQTPVDELLNLIGTIKRPAPLFSLSNTLYERDNFFPEIAFYLERIKVITDNGWQVDDFYRELEKRSILLLVKEYNTSIEFPQEFIDRAKLSFPNLKFIQASRELE